LVRKIVELTPLELVLAFLFSILYVWVLCNVPALVAGLKRIPERKQKERKKVGGCEGRLPSFSIIVPVKNEEKVVKRILDALLNLDYPLEKVETIVVDDGSTDKTAGICTDYVRRYPNQIRYLQRPSSEGKPSALNYALQHAKGEIIATFDADNVPASDALRIAASHFEDPAVDAVQGRIDSINADENMLTKCVLQEMAIFYDAYLRGKAALNLFVPLAGTCQFIRRSVLLEAGGWEEESLSEDMELSARLTRNDCTIRYASEIRSWEESPSSVAQLTSQRLRWYRGCLDAALKYGKLLRKPSLKSMDAEITLVAPCMLTVSFFGFLLGIFASLYPITTDFGFMVLAQATTLLTLVTLSTVGLVLIYVTKPKRIANLLWLPFMYAFWTLQTFVASYALLQVVFRRPRKWEKTVRTGAVTNHSLVEESDAKV